MVTLWRRFEIRVFLFVLSVLLHALNADTARAARASR
jgi:hypothetical protein